MRFASLSALVLAFAAGAFAAALLLKPDLRRVVGVPAAGANAGLYPERDWSRGGASKLNISVFVFSDRNRNGRYDLEDQPLNRIAVNLARPDGSSRIARSNINGYTNFSMQAGGDDADIVAVDAPYRFEVLAPPGWKVTTGNARQVSRFRALPGAVAGLAAESPPAVVGLVPPAEVRGLWPDHARQRLLLESAQGAKAVVSVLPDGAFAQELGPGVWQATTEAGLTIPFELGFAPVVLAEPHDARDDAISGERVLVDFDDIERSFIEKLAWGYQGLDWDYLLAVENQYYKGPGYVNGLMSGEFVAYNSSGHPVTVQAMEEGDSFDFVGGYFSAGWHNAEGETLRVRAFRGEEEVAATTLRLSHLAPVYLQAGFRRITRLHFETAHYWQVVMDDLVFVERNPGVAEVPGSD
jgi:hypothetical protein